MSANITSALALAFGVLAAGLGVRVATCRIRDSMDDFITDAPATWRSLGDEAGRLRTARKC